MTGPSGTGFGGAVPVPASRRKGDGPHVTLLLKTFCNACLGRSSQLFKLNLDRSKSADSFLVLGLLRDWQLAQH